MGFPVAALVAREQKVLAIQSVQMFCSIGTGRESGPTHVLKLPTERDFPQIMAPCSLLLLLTKNNTDNKLSAPSPILSRSSPTKENFWQGAARTWTAPSEPRLDPLHFGEWLLRDPIKRRDISSRT